VIDPHGMRPTNGNQNMCNELGKVQRQSPNPEIVDGRVQKFENEHEEFPSQLKTSNLMKA
jgi:hypothetical protein